MIAKKLATTLTLVAVAAAGLAASSPSLASGYGYGSGKSWGGYQSHRPKRQKVYRPAYNGSNPHLAWCYDRYRSYRRSDNTFQPYHGPRKDCLSPYVAERLELFANYRRNAPEQLFQDQVEGRGEGQGDRFGNLPESVRNSAGPEGGIAGQADAFGNLPEQAVAAAGTVAPAEPGQPAAVLEVPAAAQPPAEPQAPVAEVSVVEPSAAEVPSAGPETGPVLAPAAEAADSGNTAPAPANNGQEDGQSETD